jgi:type III secretory pathway component EscR
MSIKKLLVSSGITAVSLSMFVATPVFANYNNYSDNNKGNDWMRDQNNSVVDTDPVHYQICRDLLRDRTDQDPVHYQYCRQLLGNKYGNTDDNKLENNHYNKDNQRYNNDDQRYTNNSNNRHKW